MQSHKDETASRRSAGQAGSDESNNLKGMMMTAPLTWANMKKPETRLFQAHATGVRSCYADTPRGAADNFFRAHPTKRKCAVIEGWHDGQAFVVKFGNPWPKSWKGITKKTANTLPDTLTGE